MSDALTRVREDLKKADERGALLVGVRPDDLRAVLALVAPLHTIGYVSVIDYPPPQFLPHAGSPTLVDEGYDANGSPVA